jgi:cell division protein FtsB
MFCIPKYLWQLCLIFILLLLQLHVWFGTTGILSLQEINTKSKLEEEHMQHLLHTNEELRHKIRLLQEDDTYMQNYIRHKLNMIAQDETFYQFIE